MASSIGMHDGTQTKYKPQKNDPDDQKRSEAETDDKLVIALRR